MRAAGKEFKPEITEVEAKKSAASVNENNRQRNQDADYGSGSKKDGYFRKVELPAKKSRHELRKWEQKSRLLP